MRPNRTFPDILFDLERMPYGPPQDAYLIGQALALILRRQQDIISRLALLPGAFREGPL